MVTGTVPAPDRPVSAMTNDEIFALFNNEIPIPAAEFLMGDAMQSMDTRSKRAAIEALGAVYKHGLKQSAPQQGQTPAGRTWLTLVERALEAAQRGDTAKTQQLRDLADMLEGEFTIEIAAERQYWRV